MYIIVMYMVIIQRLDEVSALLLRLSFNAHYFSEYDRIMYRNYIYFIFTMMFYIPFLIQKHYLLMLMVPKENVFVAIHSSI